MKRVLKAVSKAAVGVAAVVLLLILYRLIGCPFRFLFGVPCPGCGMTRAGRAIVQGRFAESLVWHPLFVPTVLVVGAAIIARWRTLGTDVINVISGGFSLDAVSKTVVFVAALLFVAVYVARMIYMFPHTEPMMFNQGALLFRVLRLFSQLLSQLHRRFHFRMMLCQ